MLMEEKKSEVFLLRCENGCISRVSSSIMVGMIEMYGNDDCSGAVGIKEILSNIMGLADLCYEAGYPKIAAVYYRRVMKTALEYCYSRHTMRYMGYAYRAEELMEKIFYEISPEGRYEDLHENIDGYVWDLMCLIFGE